MLLRALIACAWLACAGTNAIAQRLDPATRGGDAVDPSALEEKEGMKIALSWRFDRAGDMEGWQALERVAPLEIHDGALVIENIGTDPHVLGPAVLADSSEYQFLAMRCRSTADGETQIYYKKRDEAGFRDTEMIPLAMKGDRKWHTYAIDLRRIYNWSGHLERLRIDPVNGGKEVGAKFEIDWIALYTTAPWISPLLPHWQGDDTLVLGFENRGGREATTPVELRRDGRLVGVLPVLEVGGRAEIEIDARDFPAHFWIEAWFAGARSWRGRMVKPIGPVHASDADEDASAISIGSGVGELARGEKMRVRLAPIASLTLRGPGNERSYYEFDVRPGSSEDEGTDSPHVYRESLEDPLLASLVCTTSIFGTTVRTTLEASAPIQVLRFEGPRMLESRPHSHALFPGLEYLDQDEESSQAEWTGPHDADRTTPAPYKITAPMIAVEYDRGPRMRSSTIAAKDEPWVATIGWNPEETSSSGPGAPSAEFLSRKCGFSYATVFVPSVLGRVDENTRYALRPYSLPALARLEISAQFQLTRGNIEDVFAEHWMPNLPEPPGLEWAATDEHVPEAKRAGPGSHAAVEHIVATSMLAYTRTLFDAAARGWKTHIAIGEPHAWSAQLAAVVLAESVRSDHPEYAAAIGLHAGDQIESLIGTAGALADDAKRKSACVALAGMSQDGSVPYRPTAEMTKKIEEFTRFWGALHENLGQPGSTEAGFIALAIQPLLEYAACTRDPVFVVAGERALARMNAFTVPRGAQTWEIHMRTPDLYASANCVIDNLWGWRITGDQHYLDEAVRWAKTGVPFLYLWEPPYGRRVDTVQVADKAGEGPKLDFLDPGLFYADANRQINPFGSIPAFGTSWYAVTWLGMPVQWCGLAWSNAVRELDAVRSVPSLVRAADGVFRSGANQQSDKGYLAGTLPDSWQIANARSRQPFIIPERILEYSYRMLGVPRLDSIQYERLAGTRRSYVASRALLSHVQQDAADLALDAHFFRGQNASILVGGTGGQPQSVKVNGRKLEPGADLWQTSWLEWDGARGALLIRWVATGQDDRIEIVD